MWELLVQLKKEKFGRDDFKSKLTLNNPSLIDQEEEKW